MPSTPATKPSTKRKRKAQLVVDSDNESDYESPTAPDSPPATTKPKPKQTKTPTKGKATTRKRKEPTSQPVEEEDTEKDKDTTTAEDIQPTLSQSEAAPAAAVNQDVEMKDKEEEKEMNANEEKRPVKRSKLPSMRRNPSAVAPTAGSVSTPPPEKTSLSQPTTSSTSTVVPAGPPRRKIVDAPPSGDVDLRNEDVFSQLFKKSGTGKADTRYDLTSSERLEQQRIEMQKMRDAYFSSRSSQPTFDLAEQSRKLIDVQRYLEQRGSRVCVNVVGSCIMNINQDWMKSADKGEGTSPES